VAVAGVLFDSGDTLVRPVGGRWNPRFDFEDVVRRHVPRRADLPDGPGGAWEPAFAAGERFLATARTTPPRDDYHRVVLAALGVADPSAELLAELGRPLDVPVLEPYPEVPAVVAELRRRGARLAIVSDNWSGVDRLYRQLGLRSWFSTIVVSADVGANKPDPRLWRQAADNLGLEPAVCLVVDDDPDLVAAAIAQGYQGVAIHRTGTGPPGVPWVATLHDIVDLVDDAS
jgi:FMN phosphatase YigB (HAD superfamily)